MAEQLKNLISNQFVKELAEAVSKETDKFQKHEFLRTVLDKSWSSLELKARLRTIVHGLGLNLKLDYPNQIKVLKRVAPQFTGLKGLLFPDFVDVYGRSHWDDSMAALEYFTPYSSSEFAVRPFFEIDETRMLAVHKRWSRSADEHVRRLASEGCRPRLPWSFKLRGFIKKPQPVIAILENLKSDSSLYVRKSVANNLNDISKDHPDLVLKIARSWIGKNENTDWILKHALRGLLKKGNTSALKLFGVGPVKGVKIDNLSFPQKSFSIGSHVEFSFLLSNQSKSRKLRLEYAIHYVKKTGTRSRKVFKLLERDFDRGSHDLNKRHSLRQMTTRRHYEGRHLLDVIVNGQVLASREFILKK